MLTGGKQALYYPYPVPSTRGWLIDALLYFDEILVLGDEGEINQDSDLAWLSQRGIVRAVERETQVFRRSQREALASTETVLKKRSLLPEEAEESVAHVDRMIDGPLPADLGRGISYRLVVELWEQHPDLVALRNEVGLEGDPDQYVVYITGKFGGITKAEEPVVARAIALSRQNRLSEAARRGAAWLMQNNYDVRRRENAALHSVALASHLSENLGVLPATDFDVAGQFLESDRIGTRAIAYGRYKDDMSHAYLSERHAESILVRIMLSTITLSDGTDLQDVLLFKEKNISGLRQLHAHIDEISNELGGEYPSVHALRNSLVEAWSQKFEALLSGLEVERRRSGLRAGPDFVKAALFTSAPPVVSIAAGAPMALAFAATAAAGVFGILATGIRLHADRAAILDAAPVGYIFRASRAL